MRGLFRRRALMATVASVAATAACIIVVAPLIAGGASAGPADRAEPVPARGMCPDTLCVFTQEDFGGTQVDVTKLGVSNKVDNQIPGQALSLINDRDSGAFFYRKRDGRGRAICINSGDYIYALHQVQLNGLASTRLLDRNCPKR